MQPCSWVGGAKTSAKHKAHAAPKPNHAMHSYTHPNGALIDVCCQVAATQHCGLESKGAHRVGGWGFERVVGGLVGWLGGRVGW